MRRSFLSFSPPLIGEEEIAEVVDTLRSDWITTGPKTKRFEQEFARFVGAPAALGVNSATSAMLVGLAALGIGPGDEVITTPMTFCSTVHVIQHVGAHPVLADIDPETLNLDPDGVARTITPRTKAVMPVHLYGHPCEMVPLMDLAARHGLHLLEDAAHALPAWHNGRMIGSLGNMAAFSFYATKNLTTGEGGMLAGSSDLIEKARIWSLHGMNHDAHRRYAAEGSWRYEVLLPGFKCNMTDIQAAMGLQQLKKLSRFHQRRREIARMYSEAFSVHEEIQIPVERPHMESAWHLYVIRINPDSLSIGRDQFIEELRARNIGAGVHFIPIHLHPYYRDKHGYRPSDFPIAFGEFQRILTLPLNLRMSDADVEYVIEAVDGILKRFRRRAYAMPYLGDSAWQAAATV
jgi:dTDP-4-amino-4,6-dideoxygalactose transaminase